MNKPLLLRLTAVVVVGLLSASALQATPANYWGGGSGIWSTSATGWSISPSGPFTSTYSGTSTHFGQLGQTGGTTGTLTLGSNITTSGILIVEGTGYTVALAGHSLSVSSSFAMNAAATFDFNNGSTASFGNASGLWLGTLTIANFVTGVSTLQFGTSSSDLFAGNLSLINFSGYTNGGAAQIDANGFVTPTGVSAIPEPSTYAALFGLAALGLAAIRRRTSQRAERHCC